MSLSTGLYTIRSAAFDNHYVGRSPIEYDSVSFKPIISLPSDTKAPEWTIQNKGNGRYCLIAGKLSTADINKLIFAIPGNPDDGELWDLKPLPHFGYNQYLIQTDNHTAGWVLPKKDDYTQVAAVYPSNGPKYPSNQRWIIESLEDLD